VLAVLTLLYGFGLGIVFGLDEEAIKSQLKASATEVRQSIYDGDDAAIQAVLDKSWVYIQRAHLHAGGLGNTALGLTLLVVLLGASPKVVRGISLGLGAGGLGYSLYWLWAAFRAPSLGGTAMAKESLKWLAVPSSGAVMAATVAVAVLLVAAIIRPPATDSGRADIGAAGRNHVNSI
jgi:hypothetical protein